MSAWGGPVEGAAVEPVDSATSEDDGTVVEVVETHVVDTVVADADGEVTEVVDVDTLADTRLEQLDDGSAAVAGAESVVGAPEALPFEMPARERFATLDDVEVTGDARVDAATARLDEVPDLPTSEHVEVYEDVHRRLQDALSDTEVR